MSRTLLALALAAACALAQEKPKQIPPPGIPVPEDVRAELTTGAAKLAEDIAKLKTELAAKPELLALLPDVEIFHKAVDWALRYDEFFDAKQFAIAREQLATGHARAAKLRAGDPEWTRATGLVVRGYRSQIDDSVQPFGLVVPEGWKADDTKRWRLDIWFHGRGEKLTELDFIAQRSKNPGDFAPPEAIVVHPYGRFCNANKFAGETDTFEVLEKIRDAYRIDAYRITVRGFSMGGAAAWHFATHHAGMWAAAAPGAGFAETQEFYKVFAEGKEAPPWWEQVLWRWYDATETAANLANVPTIAYSGELDGQKQAADIMLRFAAKEGLRFPHVIGPQTAHKYHPDSKVEIEKFVSEAAAKGREKFPKHIRFSTQSLIYPNMEWLHVVGLDRQWERADIDAKVEGDRVVIVTKNVNELLLAGVFGDGRTEAERVKIAEIDGQSVPVQQFKAGARFHREAGQWKSGPSVAIQRKAAFACGPIDHAFMSRFLHVRPTGKPLNDTGGAWAKSEMEHATAEWRRVFRGDALLKDDKAVSEADIANSNLVLWGDPSSNAVLAKIADKLPLKWTKDTLEFRGYKLDAAHHAPILIFPNPLNPDRYVVLNSGHTFREDAAANNSNQTPKLPDWAIIDLRTPPGPKWPGLVIDAGFFDEQWK